MMHPGDTPICSFANGRVCESFHLVTGDRQRKQANSQITRTKYFLFLSLHTSKELVRASRRVVNGCLSGARDLRRSTSSIIPHPQKANTVTVIPRGGPHHLQYHVRHLDKFTTTAVLIARSNYRQFGLRTTQGSPDSQDRKYP